MRKYNQDKDSSHLEYLILKNALYGGTMSPKQSVPKLSGKTRKNFIEWQGLIKQGGYRHRLIWILNLGEMQKMNFRKISTR